MFTDLNKVLINQAEKSGLSLFGRKVIRQKPYVLGAIGVCVLSVLMVFAGRHSGSSKLSLPLDMGSDIAGMDQNDLMQYAYKLQKKVADNPEEFQKLTARQVSLMLAKPDLERKDFPSVAWQYRSESCVVDVFYTASNADNLDEAQVQYYEIRPRQLITQKKQKDVDGWGCMQSLYGERQKTIEASFRQMFASLDDSQNGS